MKRRILLLLLIFLFPVQPVEAEPIRWVDFSVPYESLKYALDTDITTAEQEQHLGWIQTLALAGWRTGGKCGLASVKQAVVDLRTGKSPEELLGALYKYYDYYFRLTRRFWAALWGIMPFWTMDSGKKLMA